MNKKVCAIIQARTASSRLPNKVMLDLCGRPLIIFLIERLKRSVLIDEIVLATTNKKNDDELSKIVHKEGIKVIRGSEDDVLTRFVDVINDSKAQFFLRITADCPIIDPYLVDELIKNYFQMNLDYACNNDPPTLPDGLDAEIFNKKVLLMANENCKDIKKREHVTPWIIKSNLFKTFNLANNSDLSEFRWTVDEPEDMEVIRNIVCHFNGSSTFRWTDVLKLHKKKPELFIANKRFKRNEGETMSNKAKILRRLKRQLFNKLNFKS